MPFCAYCGNEISAQARYCPNCGHPQRTAEAPAVVVAAPEKTTEGYAIASLILGIFAFVPFGFIPVVPGILAVIFGRIARRNIRETGKEGTGLAKAGEILGWVNIGLWIVFAIVIVLFFASWGVHSIHVQRGVNITY